METPMLNPIVQLADRASKVAGSLAALCLFGIFGLILSEVFARDFLGYSIRFSWDFAGYLMGALFLLGAGPALREGVHVRVTALRDVVPDKLKWLMDVGASLVGLLVTALIFWAIGSMAWLNFLRGTTSATVSATPLWIPQCVMAIGAAVFFLQMVAQTLRVFSGHELTNADAEDTAARGDAK